MILIVDFGSQTAHLIGRRLRQIGAIVEYINPEEALEQAKKLKPNGIILSGGPSSVYDKDAPTVSKEIFDLGIPMLGICYGWQIMAYLLGGNVKNTAKEYGQEKVSVTKPIGVFDKLSKKQFIAIVSHGDTVISLPEGFVTTAITKNVEFTGVENAAKHLYGLQFHPEAHHTECGMEVLKNFAMICNEKLEPLSLDPEKIIAEIKKTVGNQKVICAVSGGVDSTVAAFLIAKAIGQNLIPVYVESGLMRQDTDKHVTEIFRQLVRSNLIIKDERKRFIKELKGVTDSEQKRKVIGRLYVEIFQEIAKEHPDATFLGQGTIYSDVIESKGSKHASHIKSHHNVGGLPKDMHLKLLEPLRNFYKDEVREIGRKAGLPEEIVMQQPWPGPGHAVNVMGEVTEKRLAQVMQADQIVVEEMKKANLYDNVFECFAIMTSAYSTAVKGDERVYAEVIAIRSYDSIDIMTAQWTRIPYEILAQISSRIVNEVPDVSRVVYDITSKPPATMRWE